MLFASPFLREYAENTCKNGQNKKHQKSFSVVEMRTFFLIHFFCLQKHWQISSPPILCASGSPPSHPGRLRARRVRSPIVRRPSPGIAKRASRDASGALPENESSWKNPETRNRNRNPRARFFGSSVYLFFGSFVGRFFGWLVGCVAGFSWRLAGFSWALAGFSWRFSGVPVCNRPSPSRFSAASAPRASGKAVQTRLRSPRRHVPPPQSPPSAASAVRLAIHPGPPFPFLAVRVSVPAIRQDLPRARPAWPLRALVRPPPSFRPRPSADALRQPSGPPSAERPAIARRSPSLPSASPSRPSGKGWPLRPPCASLPAPVRRPCQSVPPLPSADALRD